MSKVAQEEVATVTIQPRRDSDPIVDSDYKGESTATSSINDEKRPPLAASEAKSAGGFGLWVVGLFSAKQRRKNKVDLDSIATQESVFETDQGAHYHPTEAYEGYKAFDTLHRWTWREEKVVIRKVDTRIFLWLMIMFLSLNINRYNLPTATADKFLKDLNLSQSDYNLGNTIYRLAFLVAELPSQLISKRIGPDRWMPIQLAIASFIAASQFWLSGRVSFFVTRILIGLFQGGFIPDVILYLSYYYTKHELPIRLGLFWVMNYLSNVVTGFLAVGLLEMRGISGKSGWAWMFLIEGLICFIVAIVSLFLLPPSPSETKSRFRPKGYFTDDQVKIIVNKVLRDDPGKSTMHNREGLPLRTVWQCMKNTNMYPLYVIGVLFGLGGYPISNYFQISMRELGFNRVTTNLLTIPHSALSIFNLVAITIASELVDARALICLIESLWMLPNYIALMALPHPSGWQYFAIATVLLGFPYVHAIQVAWTSRNSGDVATRTVSASLYNIGVQTSAIIGANLYQAGDAPRYKKANTGLIVILCFNIIILYPCTRLFYKRKNEKREKIWSSMTSEQKTEYLATTTEKGNQSLDFRFAY